MKTVARSRRPRPRVLVIGPTAPAVGGMVTVIEQLMTGPLTSSFELISHPANSVESKGRSLLKSLRRHLGQVVRLARCVGRGAVDVVHVHTCSGFTFYRNLIDAAVARWLGVPVVLHIHGARFDAFCANSGPLGGRLIRRGLTRADRVVVLSEQWRNLLKPFAPKARFAVVPNGVTVPEEVPDEPDKQTGAPCEFVFLGSIGRRKGSDTLLQAAARLRDRGIAFHLTMAGPIDGEADDWSLDDELRRWNLAECITYVGPVTGGAKDALLDRCDCLVLPSRAEGLPLVLLEAGARQRAVVATAVGAIPEVIDDPRLGLVVPPDDPERLAAAMTTVLTDPVARQAMGRALRARIGEQYSLAHQSRMLADIYGQLIQRKAAAPAGGPALAGGHSR